MNVLSLFSGIGGIDLGLERAGMRVVAQCEIDPFCRAVLARHWPDVPRFADVRELHAVDVPRVDLVAGGFPCQDVSAAGKGAGIGGARSGLWREMARLVGECRPAWVLIENVPALRTRGADRVLADLEALGYDSWPMVVGAWAVGAPHRRDRVWIVAHADESRPQGRNGEVLRERAGEQSAGSRGASMADAGRICGARRASIGGEEIGGRPHRELAESGWWLTEPNVGRVANGVPRRVDRLRSLGNAVVPQVVEAIGRAIMKQEAKP